MMMFITIMETKAQFITPKFVSSDGQPFLLREFTENLWKIRPARLGDTQRVGLLDVTQQCRDRRAQSPWRRLSRERTP